MTISIIVVFGTLIAGLVVGVVVSSPGIAVVPLIAILGAIAVILPIVMYPISYTLWQAVDLTMHPPELTDPATPPPRR